jgi:DNA-nicking Smr family endonuclease
MTKPDIHDENACDLFRQAVGEVKPVDTGKIEKDPSKPPPLPHKLIEDEQRVVQDMLSDAYDPTEIQPGDILSFRRDGIQNRLFRKLKRGEYSIQSELDLHGYTVESARTTLFEFLRQSQAKDHRVVRIIHGKGHRSSNRGPVLKTMVNRWLRHCDPVLAFHSAQPRDGGTGAVYVLLKRI